MVVVSGVERLTWWWEGRKVTSSADFPLLRQLLSPGGGNLPVSFLIKKSISNATVGAV